MEEVCVQPLGVVGMSLPVIQSLFHLPSQGLCALAPMFRLGNVRQFVLLGLQGPESGAKVYRNFMGNFKVII